MKIYTKTGDKGKTSLFDLTRVLKSHPRVETYGTIDELNSMIGLTRSNLSVKHKKIDGLLSEIQHDLLEIGSSLATPHPIPVPGLAEHTLEFEKVIDELTVKMPPLTLFILPGGGKGGAMLHVCRTITRRAERQLVKLMQTEKVDPAIVIYLNRLSDFFFTTARFVNHKDHKRDVTWIKK